MVTTFDLATIKVGDTVWGMIGDKAYSTKVTEIVFDDFRQEWEVWTEGLGPKPGSQLGSTKKAALTAHRDALWDRLRLVQQELDRL